MERNIKLLGLFNFFTDFKFHSAVLIIYFAHVTGSYMLATSLFSAVMIASAIFEIPTGIFSDFIGRKKTVILGALSATISAILYAAGYSYWPLFIGAIFEGLSRAWYSGNNDALLYDSVRESGSKESFAHHFGKTSSMFQLALMIGAVTGSIIANWSFPIIMWLSVLPQFVCVCIAMTLRDPQYSKKGKTNIFSHVKISSLHIWNNRQLRLLSFSDILGFGIGESSFHFSSAFIATLWPIWAIGIARLISFGGAFIGFRLSGKIIKKFNEYNILIFANLYTRMINLIAYSVPTLISPILMTTPAFLYGPHEVSKNALMQQQYTNEQRATLSSLTSFFGSLFYGIFAPVIGFMADTFGPAKSLIIAQLCMFIVLFINIRLKYEHSRN